jgi:hypothetical protein
MALVTQAKRLVELLGPEHLEAAVKTWVDGLKAMKKVYDPSTKGWIEEPDWRERRENANMIVAYMEGKPIERQVQVTGNFEELGDLLNRIRESPVAMRELANLPSLHAMPNDSDSLQIGQTVTTEERPNPRKQPRNRAHAKRRKVKSSSDRDDASGGLPGSRFY